MVQVWRSRAASCLAVFFSLAMTWQAAALGPENVLLVVNRASQSDLAIANHYRFRRGIPDRNIVYLDYTGSKTTVPWTEFRKAIYDPVSAYIKAEKLESQISVWATTPSFPFRIGGNSLSWAVFSNEEVEPFASPQYGPAGFRQGNPYADTMVGFEPAPEGKPRRYLHMVLDAGDEAATLAMIDKAVTADYTKPVGVVYYLDGVPPRDTRKHTIPIAQRLLSLIGVFAQHVPDNVVINKDNVLGIYCGNVGFYCDKNRYVPGALGDILTSLSASFDNRNDQTDTREFLKHGCAGTYGCVIEPFNYPQKFPDAKLYLYYSLGFTAVESYWMSVVWPQQGLFLGDPLTRPFADKGDVEFDASVGSTEAKGVVPIAASASFVRANGGVTRMRMYLDGRRISDYAAAAMPANQTIVINFADERYEIKTQPDDTLVSISKRMGAMIDGKSAGASIPFPGELVLLLADPTKSRTISITNGSPLVKAFALRKDLIPGRARQLKAPFVLQGMSKEGDEVVFELREKGKKGITERYRIDRAAEAGSIANLISMRMSPKLPSGYFIAAGESKSKSDVGALTVAASATRAVGRPAVKLSINRAAKSTLRITPDEDFTELLDPTLEAYAGAWIRFCWGEPVATIVAKLPTERLADGQHTLRLVAERGWMAKPTIYNEASFVVRNQPGRLTLVPLAEKISLAAGPVKVARAEIESLETKKVEILVNGKVAGVAEAPFELTVDPAKWGRGAHTITARCVSATEKKVFSDNEFSLAILP